MVRSVTDTTGNSVPTDTAPTVGGHVEARNRWWAWAVAVTGVALLVVVGVTSLLPATLVSSKQNQRTGEIEPTPYTLTPASADAVNDRIVFGELPAGVERFGTTNAFHFVTVTSPKQSVLSWFAGRNNPAIDFLTEEDKFGVRTPEPAARVQLADDSIGRAGSAVRRSHHPRLRRRDHPGRGDRAAT